MCDNPGEAVARVLGKLNGVKRSGRNYIAKCPAHDDSKHSLSIAVGEDGRVLLKCHAGCETDRIVSTLGLRMADLFPRRDECGLTKVFSKGSAPSRTIVATYDYRDEDG